MQTISRVGGIITKAAACQAARQEFARQFQTMSASMGYWHLYACRGGLVIAQMGEPDPELVLLVANVHAGTVEQVVNSLCHQLDREGTPHVWIEPPQVAS